MRGAFLEAGILLQGGFLLHGGFLEEVTFELGLHEGEPTDSRAAAIKERLVLLLQNEASHGYHHY